MDYGIMGRFGRLKGVLQRIPTCLVLGLRAVRAQNSWNGPKKISVAVLASSLAPIIFQDRSQEQNFSSNIVPFRFAKHSSNNLVNFMTFRWIFKSNDIYICWNINWKKIQMKFRKL